MRLLAFLLLLPRLAFAQELHTFENGEAADAQRVNQNFQLIRESIPTAVSDLENDINLSDCAITAIPASNTARLKCGDTTILLPSFVDADEDGYPESVAVVEDCGPLNPSVYPNAPELEDGLDNDCNNIVDDGFGPTWFLDNDGDGFGDISESIQATEQPAGYVNNGDDCDDLNAATYPGATELEDGIDNDCNGTVDDILRTYYLDADGDGFGSMGDAIEAMQQPDGYVDNAFDCDDFDYLINPDAPEQCDNLDNNCDNRVDEFFDLEDDPQNCGLCGNVCDGLCEAGICEPEPEP